MKLRNLKIHNFFSHEDSYINFDDVQEITLVMGSILGSTRESNGSGKSAIIEAILYALFERTRLTDNKNAVLDDMVRWNSDGKMLVELQFELKDILYRIERTRDAVKGKGITVFEVFDGKVWKSLSEGKKGQTNKEIVSTIGIDYKTFSASICFQQQEVDRFVSAGETERKSIIRNILQLDQYDEYKTSSKAKSQHFDVQIKALDKQLESVNIGSLEVDLIEKQTEIKKADNLARVYQLELEAIKSQLERFRKDQILFNDQIEKKRTIESQIQTRAVSIERMSLQIKQAELKKSTYQKLIIEKDKELSQVELSFSSIKDSFVGSKSDILKRGKAADSKLKESEKFSETFSKEFYKLVGELENIDRDILNIKGLSASRCPTCYHELSIESKDSSVNFLKAHKDLLTIKKKASEESYDQSKQEIVTYRAKVEDVKAELQDFIRWTKEKLHLEEKLGLVKQSHSEALMIIQDQMSIIEENKGITKGYEVEKESFEATLNDLDIDMDSFLKLNEKISAKDEKYTNTNQLLVTEQVSKGRLQAEIRQIEDTLSSSQIFRKEREHLIQEKFYYDQLVKIFGKEIPSLIIENACHELSLEANKVLEGISSDTIDFVTQRKNKDGSMKEVFEIEISRPTVNKPILIDNLSNGQRFRIVFAIRIALSRLLVRRRSATTIDFLFYDECFSSLDEKGIDDVIDVFRYLKKEFAHQLIITHRTDLRERFGSNVITVNQDDNGISKITT